jgi:hypothetical protein
MLAGPLARWSTRAGVTFVDNRATGLLAGGKHPSMIYMPVHWNQTMAKLDAASFPYNQLLDFLPDSSADWHYEPGQWNSTWSLDCNRTQRTEFDFITTGDEAGGIFAEVPALVEHMVRPVPDNVGKRRPRYSWTAHVDDDIARDILFFLLASTPPSTSVDDTATIESNNATLYMSLNAYHASHVPYSIAHNATTSFGIGTARRAEYTGIDCKIHQPRRPNDPSYTAHPWINATNELVGAYTAFYEEDMNRKTHTPELIYPPSPLELIRFLQAYMITKDTQLMHSVPRNLRVKRPSVEISAAAVASLSIYFACVILGLLWAAWTGLQERRRSGSVYSQNIASLRPIQEGDAATTDSFKENPLSSMIVPRSQLDWLLHCVRETCGRDFDTSFFGKGRKDLKSDARAAIYGLTNGSDETYVRVGRRKDAPYVVPVRVVCNNGKQ